MPYSKQTFAYAGGARTFTIALTLGYIKEADIEVYVVGEFDGSGDQIFRTFTFDSEFVVNVTDSIVNPSSVVVQRTVSKSVFEADFEAGADITNRNVMLDFRQLIMLMHEILDGRIDGIDVDQRATDAEASAAAALVSELAAAASAAGISAGEIILRDGTIAMTGQLTLLATPVSDTDAASKKYVDDSVGGGGVMLLDGSQQMTGAMSLKAASPTTDNHATRKKYVDDEISTAVSGAGHAPIDGPLFTGDPRAPTKSAGDNSVSIATTAYADAAAGIGMVLIGTVSPSASAAVEFTGLSAFIGLVAIFEDVDTTGQLNLTFSNNNGSSYLTSYLWWEITDGGDTGAAGTSIKVHNADQDLNLAVPIDATHTTGKCTMRAVLVGDTGSPAGNVYVRGGFVQSTTQIDAIKFTVSTGNLNNGIVRLFGIKG